MKMRITTLALVAVAMVALGASTASADLVLNTYASSGASVLAIPAGTANITGINLYATVTNGVSTDGFNKVFYSIYSSYSGTDTTPTDLMRVRINAPSVQNISASTIPVYQQQGDDVNFVPFTFSGVPTTGKANKAPTSQDLDGDGDLDRGTLGPEVLDTNGNLWGGIDMDQISYTPLDSDGTVTGDDVNLFLFTASANTKIATVSITRTPNAGTYGRGVTQIYMVGKPFENRWTENGNMIEGDSQGGSKLTLYQTSTAHNGSGASLTVNLTTSGLADGSGSGGSADHFIWMVRKHGTSDAFQPMMDVSSATVALTLAAIQGADPTLAFGDYDLELETKWLDDNNALGGVVLPGDNANTDSANMTLLSYTPEPGTLLFLAAGSAGLAFFRRRRGRK